MTSSSASVTARAPAARHGTDSSEEGSMTSLFALLMLQLTRFVVIRMGVLVAIKNDNYLHNIDVGNHVPRYLYLLKHDRILLRLTGIICGHFLMNCL